MLLLKRHLIALVKSGQKRQTLRLWSHPLVKPGQISYTPGLGKLQILAVELLPSLAALTEADACADGFPSLAALLTELTTIYGSGIPAGKHLYRITFEWPVVEASQPQAAPQGVLPSPQQPRGVRPSKSRRSQTHMTPQQRQELKAYLLARRPGEGHSSMTR